MIGSETYSKLCEFTANRIGDNMYRLALKRVNPA